MNMPANQMRPSQPSIINRKIGGVPVPVIGIGFVGLVYWYIKRKNANAAAQTGTNTLATNGNTPYGSYGCQTFDAYGNCIDNTFGTGGGYGGGGGISGASGGSGCSYGYDYNGNCLPAPTPSPTPAPTSGGGNGLGTPTPSPTQAMTQATTPNDPYSIGQQVAPGENIVNSVWDSVTNTWLNLTNRGGLYTAGANGGSGIGPGEFQSGGTYLGYLGQLQQSNPNQYKSENALDQKAWQNPGGVQAPGNFSNGTIYLNPNGNGGYTEVNNSGQKFTFNPKTVSI